MTRLRTMLHVGCLAIAGASLLACVGHASDLPPTPHRADPIEELVRQAKLYRADKNYVPAVDAAVQVLVHRRQMHGPDHAETAYAWWLVAVAYANVASRSQVDALYDIARSRLRASLPAHHPWVVEAEVGWIGELKNSRRRQEARDLAEDLLRTLEPVHGVDGLPLAGVHNALGHVYRNLRENDKARHHLQRAADILELHESPPRMRLIGCLTWYSWFLLRLEEHDEAWAMCNRAARLAQTDLPATHQLTQEAAGVLITIARASDRESIVDSLVAFKEAHVRPPYMQPITLDALSWDNAYSTFLVEEPSEAAWEAHARYEGYLSTAFVRLRRAPASPHTAKLQQARRELLQAWKSIEAGRQDEEAWFQVVVADSRHLTLVRAWFEERHASSPPLLPQLHAKLQPGQAVLGFVTTKPQYTMHHQTWAYLIRHQDTLRWIPVGQSRGRNSWWRKLGEYEAELNAASRWPERIPYDGQVRQIVADAGAVLINPLAEHLEGVQELVVVGSATPPTHGFPLECLVFSDGTFVNDRMAVSYVPSIPFWLLVDEPQAAATSKPDAYLFVGDPVYGNAAGEDASPLAQLQYAEREIERIARHCDSPDVLLGARATRSTVESRVSHTSYDVVHIASHAVVRDEDVAASALVFSPSPNSSRNGNERLLTARDIFLGWDLDADLVTLSSCESQRDNELTGRALHTAFFRAGARSILASLWKVDDEATALLMEHFYEGLAGQGLSKARALQRAKRAVREHTAADGSHPFAHPVYWAGFVLTGAS